MKKFKWTKLLALCLAVVLIATAAADTFVYDQNGDDKINVWDLQMAVNEGVGATDQAALLDKILGGGDELHKNENNQWEIWSSVGLYNMAKHAQAGDTFVLMQDIDMNGAPWTPIENFNGTFKGSENYSVSNMKITKSVNGNQGFFASIAEGGTVYRLNLKDVNLIADSNASYIGLLAGSCAGTVDACTTVGYVTDSRTSLSQNVYVGGLVGKLDDTGEILTDVENMLYESPTESIPNVSSQLATNFAALSSDTYCRTVAIVGDKGNGSVDNMARLQNLIGVPDPNAIAWVKNGDVTEYPLNEEEMLDLINEDGNSVVTLQSDLYVDYSLDVKYSSTWDLNGHTIEGNPTVGYGLNILAAGTENQLTTVMNGTIDTYSICVRAVGGGVAVKDAKLYSNVSACVGIYDPTTAGSVENLIQDSELYCANWGVLSFNEKNTDFSAVTVTFQRSKLVSYKSGGTALFVMQGGCTTGTVSLGYDVDLYTYSSAISEVVGVDGETPVVMASESVDIKGKTYTGMNYWTTDEAVISNEVIAEVTNGDQTIQVGSTRALADSVASDGNTKIKLLMDITNSAAMNLPYSCEVDLNGYSITNSVGNSIRFLAKGSEKSVAKVTNGTINHVDVGVCVDDGSVDISGVTFNGLAGCDASVAFYSTSSAYRSGNKIDSCYFYNPDNACVTFAKASSNFKNTGVTITNSTLISSNSYVFDKGSSTTSGVVTLGDNVKMYGKNAYLAPADYRYAGKLAGLTKNATVTANGTELTLNCWDTAKQTKTTNVLLIGNSLSMTIPTQLYNVANHEGVELFVGDLYHAGCRGYQHWEWYNNKSKEYDFRIHNDMGAWIHGDIKTSNEAMEYMNWQHISYQEYITLAYTGGTLEEALNLQESYVNNMFDMLKTNHPDAQLYFYQHWGFQVNHSQVPDIATQEKHAQLVIDFSEHVSQENGVTLIPVGEAWELARDNPDIGDTLCKADNLHASEESGGLYLNGCVFFEVMFQNSCIGNTWRSSNGPSDAIHLALQQHAHDAVAAFYGEDYAK